MTRGNVLAALVVSALVGCSDPKAGTLPSASPTTTFSTSATPSASASPDLREELHSALQTYFDALYAAGLDPANKTDALAALIDPTCSCWRAVEVLREEARLGRYLDYHYTLSDVAVIEVGRLGGNLRYTVDRSAGAERDRSGAVIERYPKTTEKYSAHFTRDGGRWLLDRVVRFK